MNFFARSEAASSPRAVAAAQGGRERNYLLFHHLWAGGGRETGVRLVTMVEDRRVSDKVKGAGVDAVPLPCRFGAVVENMTQVRT